MFNLKKTAGLLLGSVLLAGTVMHGASAGETIKFKSQHILVVSKFDSIEMPDQAGHIIGMFQAKGVGVRRSGPQEPAYKIEAWGTGDYRKDGAGKDRGYARFIFADGSSYDEDWAGTGSGGHDVGTATYYNGTGRFKGMKSGSGSKFDCASLGDRIVCEVEGTIELP
jgi:hypothetical protein